MPYDIAPAPQNTLNKARSRTRLEPYPRTAYSSTNKVVAIDADHGRPIDAMLLVHQERVETFRLIVAAIRRGLKTLARPYAA